VCGCCMRLCLAVLVNSFTHAQVPLTIFEARYRVLFSTLLAGAEG